MIRQVQHASMIAALGTVLANKTQQMMTIARRYRWWFVAVGLLAAVVGAYFAGLSRGMHDGEDFQRQLETSSFAIASNPRIAEGGAVLERLLADRVDASVLRYHQRRSATGWQWVSNMMSTLYWFESRNRDNVDVMISRQAERRLLVVQPLRPETIDILRQKGKEGAITEIQADYVEIAVAYSAVLGREITVKQLMPDARVRYRYHLGDLSAR
jgi:hypothetical protein